MPSLNAQFLWNKELRLEKQQQQKIEKEDRRDQRKLYRWRKQELRRWRLEERRAERDPILLFRRPARSSGLDIDLSYRFEEGARQHRFEFDLSSMSHRQPFFPNPAFYQQWPGLAFDALTYITFFYTVKF